MVWFLIFERDRENGSSEFFTLLLPINKWSCILHLDFDCLVESLLVARRFPYKSVNVIYAVVLHVHLPNKRVFSPIYQIKSDTLVI